MAKFDVLNPFEPLNTPFRVRRAFECAEAAAYVLAGLNVLTAVLIYTRAKPFHVLLGNDPHTIWIVHLSFAAAAAILGLVIRRRQPAWACWVVFIWAIVECLGLTGPLYAHAAMFALRPLVLAVALPGVRAVYFRKRLVQAEDELA
jgi:hypothetical protein